MNKRVLIINTSSIYVNNATGITLRSLFGYQNPCKFIEVFWYPDSNDHKMKYRVLGYRKLSISKTLLRMRNGSVNLSIKKSEHVNNKSAIKKVKSYLRQFIVLIPDREHVKVKKEDYDFIDAFEPEVIYTLGASINALRISYKMSLRYNIPIVIHHMDNWMHCIQWEKNPLLFLYKKQLRRICRKCYERSSVSLTISEEMAKEFSNEYEVCHKALMNSIEVDKYECSPKEHDSIRFVYAGGLHLKRYMALREISDIIERINVYSTKRIEFYIYTSEESINMYESLFKKNQFTELIRAVPHEDIVKVYELSDVLVHVETDMLYDNDFFKYSISTKIPEYLSTGKDILFYGPNNLYLYNFLKEENIAFVADCVKKLEECIALIADSSIQLGEKGKRGREYAKKHFDVSKAMSTLNEVFENAALL